jgi:hypothetical protein
MTPGSRAFKVPPQQRDQRMSERIESPADHEEAKPKGAILIVSIVGLLTLALWGSFFALTFIRG